MNIMDTVIVVSNRELELLDLESFLLVGEMDILEEGPYPE